MWLAVKTVAYVLYHLATLTAAAGGVLWLAVRPSRRVLFRRFCPLVPPMPGSPIWIQACSVGEVLTAKPIISAIRRRWPEVPILLTVSTTTGYALANATVRDVPITWFPFDVLPSVRRFMSHLKPRVLVLVETEIWPNVIREARYADVPVVLVNGRLSDKHYPRYLRLRPLVSAVVRPLSLAAMQNEEYAARMRSLGAHPSSVHVTGNTKFDAVATAVDRAALERLRQENGFSPDCPVVLYGSTRPGDEALAAACWATLKKEFPSLRLIVAPRHLDRLDEALSHFDEPLLRRSQVQQGQRASGERVFVLDTVGELVSFYALATVAVIGGSFYPGVNGHNPLESAALGIPTVFGPYMRNFIDPARALVKAEGARQVSNPQDLLPVLRGLLADPKERARLAKHGREAVLANQGAINRTLDLLETAIGLR